MDAARAREFLGSWSDTEAAGRIAAYVAEVTEGEGAVPVEHRVAVFDNDGTLWSERPAYQQVAFLLAELRDLLAKQPQLGDDPVVASLLAGDVHAALAQGLGALTAAVTAAHVGMTPMEFTARVRAWVNAGGLNPAEVVYQPMLELLEMLRAAEFRVYIVTGGGVEFVRALSRDLYGVEPDDVVGTAVLHELRRDGDRIDLVRTDRMDGDPNEGAPKVVRIQSQLGARPIVAVGNSAGDTEMLAYAASSELPSLCVVIEHDDAQREADYRGASFTDPDAEPVAHVAERRGWLVVSMRDDWKRVFAGASA